MIADIPGNLPAEPNSFIGRERDLAELVAMLGRVRALTLCGPGGIGKTRLALRLAATLAPGYPDGVWIAELADADLILPGPPGDPGTDGSDPDERVVHLVATALGIRPEPDRLLADTLVEALRPRVMLLLLDTCEHLMQASAEFVQRILAGCPGVRVIATSREPLRVRGEVIWRVPPLSLPQAAEAGEHRGQDAGSVADCEAVRLFVERAAAVRPGFVLDESNTAVADICRTLDGVPLAIELAAARVRALSAEQISSRLADRFELLAQGDRTAPARQQTLRATVEWSYELLTPAERLLLSRLSVFHGWNLEMAERVCADEQIAAFDVLKVLMGLIDKSLVSLDGELNGDARYRLLDTVRELAAEQAVASGELPGLRVTHRNCTLELAERIASVAYVRGEPSWPQRVAMYHRVMADRANINLALACSLQRGDAEEGLRLCDALAGFFLASGDVAEGANWIDRLLAVDAPIRPQIRSRALALRAELSFEQQDYRGAREHAQASLELSPPGSNGSSATALRLLALVELMTGHSAQAMARADEALAAARQTGDAWEEGVALAARAATIASQGLLAEAESAYRQALDVLRDNNGWGVANVLYGLGQLARGSGDLAGAARYFGDALAIYRQIEARPEMTRCLAGIGWTALAQGDLTAARSSLAESMRLSLVTGHRLAIARGLRALAALAVASGDLGQAVRLAGAALTVFEAVGGHSVVSATRQLDEVLGLARASMGQDAVSALLADGRELSPHQATLLAVPAGRPEPAAVGRGEDAVDENAGPGVLTERQQEVAALVAQGLSNRAIGQKLFISEYTAAKHVANIFGKLGISSRAQLVTWMSSESDSKP